MAHEGRPTDRSVSYEIEHGMIGALLMYGRTGLAIAQAEGWSPALCRRPQHEALAEWLAEGIEAGAVSDLNTALAHLAMSPPTHRNAPGHSDALMMLCVAPQHAPILEAIPASVRALAAAVAVERLAVLQAELRDAAGRGDMAAVGQIGKRIAALVAPPKAKAAKGAAPEESISGDDRPDPAAIAALKKIPRRARDDRRRRARARTHGRRLHGTHHDLGLGDRARRLGRFVAELGEEERELVGAELLALATVEGAKRVLQSRGERGVAALRDSEQGDDEASWFQRWRLSFANGPATRRSC